MQHPYKKSPQDIHKPLRSYTAFPLLCCRTSSSTHRTGVFGPIQCLATTSSESDQEPFTTPLTQVIISSILEREMGNLKLSESTHITLQQNSH